jgi:hypothetical protein
VTGALGLTAGLGLLVAGLSFMPQPRGWGLALTGIVAMVIGTAVINRR